MSHYSDRPNVRWTQLHQKDSQGIAIMPDEGEADIVSLRRTSSAHQSSFVWNSKQRQQIVFLPQQAMTQESLCEPMKACTTQQSLLIILLILADSCQLI